MYDQSNTAKTGKMKGAQCRIDGKLTSDTQTNGKQTVVAYTFFVQVFDVQQGAAIFRNSKNISKGQTN
jgi:PBP1b-binding outer membrane lipoprotein LpoB